VNAVNSQSTALARVNAGGLPARRPGGKYLGMRRQTHSTPTDTPN